MIIAVAAVAGMLNRSDPVARSEGRQAGASAYGEGRKSALLLL